MPRRAAASGQGCGPPHDRLTLEVEIRSRMIDEKSGAPGIRLVRHRRAIVQWTLVDDFGAHVVPSKLLLFHTAKVPSGVPLILRERRSRPGVFANRAFPYLPVFSSDTRAVHSRSPCQKLRDRTVYRNPRERSRRESHPGTSPARSIAAHAGRMRIGRETSVMVSDILLTNG